MKKLPEEIKSVLEELKKQGVASSVCDERTITVRFSEAVVYVFGKEFFKNLKVLSGPARIKFLDMEDSKEEDLVLGFFLDEMSRVVATIEMSPDKPVTLCIRRKSEYEDFVTSLLKELLAKLVEHKNSHTKR